MSSSLGVRSGIRPWESNADSPGSANRSLHEACDDHAGRLHKLLDLNCQTGDGDGDDAALLLGTASRGCEEGAPSVSSGLPQPSSAGVSPGGQLPPPGPSDQQLHAGWDVTTRALHTHTRGHTLAHRGLARPHTTHPPVEPHSRVRRPRGTQGAEATSTLALQAEESESGRRLSGQQFGRNSEACCLNTRFSGQVSQPLSPLATFNPYFVPSGSFFAPEQAALR